MSERINKEKSQADGLGWLTDFVCRLLKTYPSFTRQFVWDELPMVEGFVYYSWAMENDAMNQFGGLTRLTDGYIAQEAKKLIKQAHEFYEKQP